MGATGTAAPNGWSFYGAMGGSNTTWTNATGIPAADAGLGTLNATLLATTTTGSGVNSNSQGRNYASSSSPSDRCFLAGPTSGRGTALQLALENATGSPINALRISYDIRRFTAASTANELPGYWLFYSLDNGTTWSNVASLNATLATVPNSVGVSAMAAPSVALSSPWNPGATLRLRWMDDNAVETSPDQITGLDNVVIDLPQPAPEVTLTAPAAGSSYNLPATVVLAADATDSNGTVTKVEFFANGAKIGEDTEAPYAFSWSGMISGAYALTAAATDNDGGIGTSAPVDITIVNPDNTPPSVTLVSPLNGAQIAGDSTTLAATATDSDGAIAKVEFYEGTTKLGEATAAPYTYQWSGAATGTYSVTARAIDNDGAATDSAPAAVTFVVPVESTLITRRPGSNPGTVWKYLDDGSDQGSAWKEPGFDDSAWATGAAPLGYGDSHIVTTVNSGPSGNRIITTYLRRTFDVAGAGAIRAIRLHVLRDDGVVVYINGAEVARQNMPEGPINYLTNSSTIVSGSAETTYFLSEITDLPPLNEGTNHIAVELHNRDGSSSDLGFDLELVTVSLPGDPPTVDLTGPADGAAFTAPATVVLAANADDSDGSVVKVEFFNGEEKLGEATAAPYTFDWTVVPQGDYVLTARATDNYGLTATSDPVNIAVGPPNTIFPTVAITSPTEGAAFLDPASIEIAANAADADGSIAKVEFFEGANKLGEATAAPYSFTWSGVPAGTYTLTARATDNLTAATVSAPVTVTVDPNLPPQITLAAPLDGAALGGGGTVNLVADVSDPEDQPLAVTFYGRPKSAPPGEDFTLVTIPDTQHYSANSNNRIQHFHSQTNWIVDSRTTLNTVFVAHMGDMVNTASTAAEWDRAKGAMSVIEDPLTTLLAHGIPWGGAPGNHDGTGSEWDTHFGPDRFAGRDYYQGNYNNSNRNNYQFFSGGGMDFIIVNLAYNSSTSGNAAILDWADALLKAHPDRRAIVTSHWLIGTSNFPAQSSWGGHGQAVYNKLRENPNLFLMLCGHIHGQGRRFDVYEGRRVDTVLQDYQSYSDGGDSWLRYYTFKPSENKIYAYTYRARNNTFQTDANSEFTLDYDMTASAPWSELGTVNLAAGERSATLPWTGLNDGEEYEWYAAVSDGPNPVGSDVSSFTASGNADPSITLDSPADGSTTTRPAKVEFAASAFDLDGSIDRVEFYNGTTKIGEDDTAPYTFSWEAPVGTHTVSARAIDGEGANTDSSTAAVTVDFDITPSIAGGGGGSVTGGGAHMPGSNAVFEAHANPGYAFAGWKIDGAPAGTGPVLEVVASEGMAIEAEFVLQLLITEIQSNQNSSGGAGDFWELTNIGQRTVDLSGWKWDDDSADPNDAAAVTIPDGTAIAPGESIVFTPAEATDFRNSWGIAPTVQVVTGGPGLGGNDTIHLFDSADAEVASLSYAAGGFTRSDGSPSTGGHAGLSAGGSANTQAMVWDPVHGTASPRYKAAVAGETGAFASTGSAADVGSPGYAGIAPTLLITEIQSNQSADGGADDFWELTNIGQRTVDLSGWKWDDDSADPNHANAVTIPDGTLIAPGESIVFTPAEATDFRNSWGIAPTVQVVTGGPGLGGDDAIHLFDFADVELASLGYGAGGFTRSDGSPSTGGHAGASAGGTNFQAMVWDPAHGTLSPRYQAAVAGQIGAFASPGSAADVGSPGHSGFSIAPSLTIRVGGSTIASGGVTTLQVEASGLPEPTLQWYLGEKGDTGNPVIGATSPTLLSAPLSTTTQFWVRASNDGGDFDSDTITVTVVAPISSVDLSNYVRVGRYGLPEPLRTALPSGTPAHNLLAQEASGVAYNWDTDTLFVVGDGGRSVTQVSKTGVLIDTMTLALGSSPQGTAFYDPEGIAYLGGGQFVMTEERDRQLVKFTYAAGTTLTRAAAQTVKLGTYVDNVGLEDVTFDPISGGYILVKEISPLGIFQTTVDFDAGTASNGSPSTVNSVDLFDPALTGMTDFAGVFALANLPGMSGQAQESHLLVLSQEDGRVVAIDRNGTIASTLQIAVSPGDTLNAAEQQHEGMSMDAAGFLYIVNENGGGGIDYPELWVYAPADFSNAPPTSLSLNSAVTEIMENTPTLAPIKLGVVAVEDDGLGVNELSLSGPDAAFFEIAGTTLYLKAGTVLDYETKDSYSVAIAVDDTSVGATPDATYHYTLTVLDQEPETAPLPALLITEVAPWSSGDSPVGADWFEVTNVSESPVNIEGWKVDDSSKSWSAAIALGGIATIAPGESVIFIETDDLAAKAAFFRSHWFGDAPPAGLQIGSYSGSGIGLSTGGDGVWLFDAAGQVHSGVSFGASPSGPQLPTFDNTAGLNDTAISKLSVSGANGAFRAAGSPAEIGSPGHAAPGQLVITEVAPWSSGNSPLGEDWFEVTNVGARVVNLAGWKMDDSSESPVAAVPLQGIYSIAPGESVIFIETNDLPGKAAAFLDLWFGASPPAGLQIGSYSGSGVGLSTGGDAVNLYDTTGTRRAKVTFGQSPSSAPYGTFDNTALLENAEIVLFSSPGVNGAFAAANDPNEVGSPGALFVTVDPVVANGGAGGSVTGGGTLPLGSDAVFTAAPNSGYSFRGWRVNGTVSPETSTTLSTTVTAGMQVEALFAYTLQLLHLSDGEAGLLASQTAPYLAALVDAFEEDHGNTLILSGGDNFIPGPFLGAGTDPSLNAVLSVGATDVARPDIAIHNLIGVEASAIGNHEWDLGSNAFMGAIAPSGAWAGARFPYISANLDYSGDSVANARFTDVPLDGAATAVPEASTLGSRLVPVAVVEKGGEKIGLVGVTTQILGNISSPSGTFAKGFPPGTVGEDDMDLLATHVQPYIDELIAEGIDKIVLLSHLQQIENERLLATKLSGVDIVLAAGSNTRLGDDDDVAVPFPGHEADFADTYPVVTAGLDGKPVLVLNTDSEYTYLGRLVVDFDENGEILVDGLAARVPVNGAYASTAGNVAAAWGVAEAGIYGSAAFAPGTKGAAVKEVVDAVQAVIGAKDGDVKGYTSVYLEGERNFVRSEETNLGSLSADANAWALRRILDDGVPVVSIKNGGGIRAQIGSVAVGSGEKLPPAGNPDAEKPAGAISQLDIENALRFNNRLMVFDTTPEGLKAMLEHGVAAGRLQGRFPQVGGVVFAWDESLPPGERIVSIALAGESGQPREAVYGGGFFSPWAPPLIRLVTLNFMANDGDGYPSKANGSNFRYLLEGGTLSDPVDPSENFTAAPALPGDAMGEQQAFVELLADRHATPESAFAMADTPAALDPRIQNLAFRSNAVPVDLTLLLGGDGTGGIAEEIAAGGSLGLRFAIAGTRLVSLSASGSEGLAAELLDAGGHVVAAFPGGGPIAFSGVLGAGDYLLRVGNPGSEPRALSLAMNADVLPPPRPDVAVGPSLGRLVGRGVYSPRVQQHNLISRKLRPVRAVATVTNRGTLPDALRVRASRGSKLFRTTYASGGRNATAALVAGRFTTGALQASAAPTVVSAKVAPLKKRLQVRKNGKQRILGKNRLLSVRATSVSSPGLSDTARIRVRTQ